MRILDVRNGTATDGAENKQTLNAHVNHSCASDQFKSSNYQQKLMLFVTLPYRVEIMICILYLTLYITLCESIMLTITSQSARECVSKLKSHTDITNYSQHKRGVLQHLPIISIIIPQFLKIDFYP